MRWIGQASASVDLVGDPARLEVWKNVWKYWTIVALNAVICAVLVLITSSAIDVQAFPALMAGLALVFMPVQLTRSIYRGSKITFCRPIVVLSSEGIQHQGLSVSLGWRLISQISKVNRARTRERTLRLVVRDDADPKLLSDLFIWNWGILPRTIFVPLDQIKSYSAKRCGINYRSVFQRIHSFGLVA